jgi:hypothetical protein
MVGRNLQIPRLQREHAFELVAGSFHDEPDPSSRVRDGCERFGSIPWFAIRILAPFVETFREMLEMRYLWKKPLKLDNRKLVGLPRPRAAHAHRHRVP